ncbi:MAG: hypothetical protein L6262_11575 [Weeksellaceae bacterium]|nr:hypothetical protein [Weeksellaceae bacterium]
MKKYICTGFLIFLINCDAGYGVFISNKSTLDIQLITEPPIESRIVIKKGGEYDSIVIKRINQSEAIGIYRIHPLREIYLFSKIGYGPGNYLPFREVKIIKDKDTIHITENNIAGKTVKFPKDRYLIEVR